MKKLFLILLLAPFAAYGQSRTMRVVNTIEELISSTNNPSQANTNIFVADPKRGGLFTWAAGATNTTDLGTIFTSSYPGASGRFLRQFTDGVYIVSWFGALGNGAVQTNETAAALAAIPRNAGGTLLFPPGNYAINLSVTNRKNVHILFDSFVREDAGIPVIVSNIVTAADNTRPIITIGDNTNFARGIIIEGGTFTGNGTNSVLLRLQGGAYECIVKNAGFFNGITNIWIQGEGAVPCAINRFENLSIQAANVNNSRAVYAAAPTTGFGYTTTSGFTGCHFNSQVPGVNTYTFQLDSTDIEMQNSRFDTLQNAPNRFSMTGGLINPQPAVMTCANVIFDGSSISPSAYADYPASPRISALVQGSYLWNGQANINGLILQEDKCQSSVVPGGQYFSMFINGAASFDRIGGTTNRTWNRAEVSDDDPTIFMLMATNGTLQLHGRTNISFATGDGSASNRLVYVLPGQFIVTNSLMNITSFRVYGAGSGIYSDTNNPTARIFTSAQSNSVRSALHLDSYQNTPAFPISIDFGLMNSTNGAFTSRIIHFANVNTNQGSELQIQTHTTSNGIWNVGMKIMNNGWFGFGLTNPASFFDINGDTMVRGTSFGVRGIPYAWPAANGAGNLHNDGAGSLTWATALTSFSVGNLTSLFTVINPTSTPTLVATDPGANILWGWDDTDNALTPIIIGANLTYTHGSHTLSATGGSGGSATNAYSTLLHDGTPLTARTNANFVGPAFSLTDDAGNNWTSIAVHTNVDGIAALGTGTAGFYGTTTTGGAYKRTMAATEGVKVINASGTTGNPTFSSDIPGLASASNSTPTIDYIEIYQGGAHKKILLSTLLGSPYVNNVYNTKVMFPNDLTPILTITPTANLTGFGAHVKITVKATDGIDIQTQTYTFTFSAQRQDSLGGVNVSGALVADEISSPGPVPFPILEDLDGEWAGATSATISLRTNTGTWATTSIVIYYQISQYGPGVITIL